MPVVDLTPEIISNHVKEWPPVQVKRSPAPNVASASHSSTKLGSETFTAVRSTFPVLCTYGAEGKPLRTFELALLLRWIQGSPTSEYTSVDVQVTKKHE